ncbi:Uncharacterized protein FWK35_00014519 [Aphis craccivora]|uniref:Uncharacterized protein n=1 Tax=Aphis craccivora TaxID=307492 RepID=A0A6G0YDK6_APHCR|nr:Uncharacterized protein FWK35_00014519 [Aphis craccivora]
MQVAKTLLCSEKFFYTSTPIDHVEDDLDPDFIPTTFNEVESVEENLDDSDLDPDYIPITEHYVEELEEDLDDINFDPALNPITEHQDNQLIKAVRKKKKFSPAYKKAVLEEKREKECQCQEKISKPFSYM